MYGKKLGEKWKKVKKKKLVSKLRFTSRFWLAISEDAVSGSMRTISIAGVSDALKGNR